MKAIWLLLSFAAFVGCASIKELEEKIDGLQKQNSSLQSSYNQQIRITKELEEKIDDLQKQNTSLQSPDDPQIKALIKISDELNIKIIDDLQKKNTFLRSENAALQTDITRLQGETASLQKNTIDEIRRLNRQITEKEHELKGLRKIE